MNDLCRVCALQLVDGEGLNLDAHRASLDAFASKLSDAEMLEVIHHLQAFKVVHCKKAKMTKRMHHLQTADMTPEERRLSKFSHRTLQHLPNWTTWDAAFNAQLDTHCTAGLFGQPVPRPKPIDGVPPNILRIQWSNVIKPDGTRKARACLNGSKWAAPHLRQFAQTYASCIEQPCMRMFFAIAAAKGLVVTSADTTNPYQQSPPPTQKCYMMINDAFRSWYQKRYGVDVDPKTHIVPLERAMQGYPEAGALWEEMIIGIPEGDELKFKLTKVLVSGITALTFIRPATISSFHAKPTWIVFSRHTVGRSLVLVKATGTIWFH
jgi:hypothetical protein